MGMCLVLPSCFSSLDTWQRGVEKWVLGSQTFDTVVASLCYIR